MIIKKTLKPGEVGYAVDLLRYNKVGKSIVCDRYNGYTTIEEANIVAQSLVDNEIIDFNPNQVMFTRVTKISCVPTVDKEFDEEIIYEDLQTYFNCHFSSDDWLLTDEDFFEQYIQKTDSRIFSFTLNEDSETDGTPIGICWLKLGYVSPSSNCGFFHFGSFRELFANLKEIKLYNQCDKKVQEEYMFWLACNTCLFKSKDPEKMIEDIARMCFQQKEGEIL